jgi:hypothetical protein
MGTGSLRFYVGVLATALCGAAAVVACGSDSESAFGPEGKFADAGGSSSSSSGSSGTTADSGASDASIIAANGIVIVHAASFGAFRLCFEKQGQRRPIPSVDLLPESNLVGVDVGSVVRIDPIDGAPGKIWAFAVDDIAQYYGPGQAGPTCEDLLDTNVVAHDVGTITDSLAFGVNLLVLRGSPANQSLRIEKIRLSAFDRTPNTLPVQVLHLAQNLESVAGNRKIGVIADALDGGDAGPFIEGSFEAGVPFPIMPYEIDYNPDDEGQFATSGFMVTLGAPIDAGADAGDAGKRQVILAQSLADIQRLSAPRALPEPWFNAGSSYVLLLLGNAQEADANADELERLHFLAIPLAGPPSADGGEPDGSSADAATD